MCLRKNLFLMINSSLSVFKKEFFPKVSASFRTLKYYSGSQSYSFWRLWNFSVSLAKKWFPVIFLFMLVGSRANSQALTLREAVNLALNNYGTIKAKGSYLNASQASAKEASS